MTMNVPPAPEVLGIKKQESQLNCELLSESPSLELRWSVDQDDIIVQLVSSTGSDRYLAFGIKADQESKIGGDVMVGWINSRTGKGGVDDYFLAGDGDLGGVTCDDSAESCPDKTKPGGLKHVEMLNSISRDNYTMLTVKRPLFGSDDFDVPVRLDGTGQGVFWSIGYKSPEMRRSHRPIKNKNPMTVDFGRPTRWNCPSQNENKSEMNDEPKRRSDDFSEMLTETTTTKPTRMTTPNPRPQSTISYVPVTTATYPEITTTPLRHWHTRAMPTTTTTLRPQPSYEYTPDNYYFPKSTQLPKVVRNDVAYQPPTQSNVPSLPPSPTSYSPPDLSQIQGQIRPPVDDDWWVPPISCGEAASGPLFFQIGPAAAHRGNQGLGSHGEALYVNGLLAPDLYLSREHTYTVVVETGRGLSDEGTFHPLYITTDQEGGYQTKTEFQQRTERVYAGVRRDREGRPVPRGQGRLCLWENKQGRTFNSYADFATFHNSLDLECYHENGLDETRERDNNPGVFSFRPTKDMPDTIYYQSFTAKHLGGVIHLVDKCHEDGVDTNSRSDDNGGSDLDIFNSVTTFRPNLRNYIKNIRNQNKDKYKNEDDITLLRALLRKRNERVKSTVNNNSNINSSSNNNNSNSPTVPPTTITTPKTKAKDMEECVMRKLRERNPDSSNFVRRRGTFVANNNQRRQQQQQQQQQQRWRHMQQQQQQHSYHPYQQQRYKRSVIEDAFEEIDFKVDDEDGPKAEALIDGPTAEAYKSNSEMPTFEHFPMRPETDVKQNYRNLEEEEENKDTNKMEDFSFADIEAAKMACIDEMQSQEDIDEDDDDYKVGYGLDNSDVYNMAPYEEEEDKDFEQPAWKQAFEQKKVRRRKITTSDYDNVGLSLAHPTSDISGYDTPTALPNGNNNNNNKDVWSTPGQQDQLLAPIPNKKPQNPRNPFLRKQKLGSQRDPSNLNNGYLFDQNFRNSQGTMLKPPQESTMLWPSQQFPPGYGPFANNQNSNNNQRRPLQQNINNSRNVTQKFVHQTKFMPSLNLPFSLTNAIKTTTTESPQAPPKREISPAVQQQVIKQQQQQQQRRPRPQQQQSNRQKLRQQQQQLLKQQQQQQQQFRLKNPFKQLMGSPFNWFGGGRKGQLGNKNNKRPQQQQQQQQRPTQLPQSVRSKRQKNKFSKGQNQFPIVPPPGNFPKAQGGLSPVNNNNGAQNVKANLGLSGGKAHLVDTGFSSDPDSILSTLGLQNAQPGPNKPALKFQNQLQGGKPRPKRKRPLNNRQKSSLRPQNLKNKRPRLNGVVNPLDVTINQNDEGQRLKYLRGLLRERKRRKRRLQQQLKQQQQQQQRFRMKSAPSNTIERKDSVQEEGTQLISSTTISDRFLDTAAPTLTTMMGVQNQNGNKNSNNVPLTTMAPNLVGVQDVVTTPVPIRAYTPSNYALSNMSPWLNSNSSSNNKQPQFKPSIKESAFFGGFDPSAIRPETGFVPMPDRGGPSVVPSLAFNVLEAEYRDVEVDDNNYSDDYDSMYVDSFPPSGVAQLPQLPGQMMPQSPTAVAVPQESYTVANVLSSVEEKLPESFFIDGKNRRKGSSSNNHLPINPPTEADFEDFKALNQPALISTPMPITAYDEQDRIDRPSQPVQIYNVLVGADMSANKNNKNDKTAMPDFKLAVGSVSEPEPAYDTSSRQQVPGIYQQVSSGVSLDPRGVEYMENSQPYGYQFPSYVSGSAHTSLGTNTGVIKDVTASDHIVYGKWNQQSDKDHQQHQHQNFANTNQEQVYQDVVEGENDETDKLEMLKRRLGLESLEDEDIVRMIEKMHGH